MGRSVQLRNVQAQSWADQVAYVSFHDGDPGTDGSNETTISRLPVTFTDPASGGVALSDIIEASMPGGTSITHIGFWDSSGNYLDSMPDSLSFDTDTTYSFAIRYTENEEAA